MDGAFELRYENPKKKANVTSKLFFGWTIPLFYKGSKRKIQLTDLYKTLPEDKSESLGNRLEYHWNKEVEKSKENSSKKPSLIIALSKTFFLDYAMYGVIVFIIHVVLRSTQPVVLAWFIEEMETNRLGKTSQYVLASILVLISLLIVFLYHHSVMGSASIGMRVRIAVSSLIYRKIIRLNKRSQGQTASGQIINILSNDVQRFDLFAPFLHFLWITPIHVMFLAYLMWNMIGINCFVGIGAMIIITIPLQTYFGKLASDLRLKVATKCDARVKHMSEIISGIQVIKMYAWEKPFEKFIQHIRGIEIKSLTHSSYLIGLFSSLNVFAERFTLFLTIVSYVLMGSQITADIVFSMAQFFNVLQGALAVCLPMAISFGAETLVAIRRLEEILVLDERGESYLEKIYQKGVKLTSVSASWISDTPVLRNLNVRIPEGQLCAVVGPVGAGKSSLLQLLLGEFPPSNGKVELGGIISYSSQEPWLFAASVRKNILFGKPYDSYLYKRVVDVCALEKDFEQFTYGDNTMVGERGVSLSGGQRARINLARAIYRQADVYLLDDPLSAVDTHVGKHLFDKCIVNYLKGKTRILVTHQLQYLKKADIIIILNEGRIEAQGTFEELSESELDFTKLLAISEECNEEREKENVEDQTQNLFKRKLSTIGTDESVCVQKIRDNDDAETMDYEESKPFIDYFKSVGNCCLVVFVTFLFLVSLIACTATDYWSAFWTTQERTRYLGQTNRSDSSNEQGLYAEREPLTRNANISFQQSLSTSQKALLDYDDIELDGVQYHLLKTNSSIYIYTLLIIVVIISVISRAMFFFKMAMSASKNIHKKMFHCLLKAPMRFFDVNPSGRVLNRFSKDMGAIDEILPRALMESITIVLVMAGILINITISNYYMVIPIVVLGSAFLKLRQLYITNAKNIKHLEGIAKSPVFSYINSTLNGLTTIRAVQNEEILIKEFDDHQNVHTSAWLFTIMCSESFGLWLDIVCVILTCIITFGFVIASEFGYVTNASLVGLAVSQSLILTLMLQHGMRQTAETVNQLTSVERVLQYTKLENEGPFETPKESLLPAGFWPSHGNIEFRNVNLIYIRGEPPVLKNLTLKIKAGEKVGIVGRTGAGKSSLISALFKLAPIEGQILIDGIDISSLGLTNLRKNISIIPQEPVLFSASLRYNLDPFNEFEDKELWEALEEVELKDLVDNLDFQVSAGGSNFSLGQRQLLCLARALLRKNKILVLDEATANVDARTDALIQRTIRTKFKEYTVLTIAHRLNTIMDSDKVLVMGSGQKLEFDHPHVLLQIPDGHFLKMVQETGQSMTQQLKDFALQAWMEKSSDK